MRAAGCLLEPVQTLPIVVPIIVTVNVLNAYVISTAKSIPIRTAAWFRNVWMAELIPIIYVRSAMVPKILPRAFDAVVKSLPM